MKSVVIQRRLLLRLCGYWPFAILGLVTASHADDESEVSPPRAEGAFLIHDVTSPYQRGQTQIRVLTPDRFPAESPLKTVYVLPVEAGRESRYGDGLKEILDRNLHNQLNAVFVAPTFSHLPWYADHPTDRHIRQETYLLKVVLPTIEGTYAVQATREGRLLLGFSKSGWGAWSLLLRQPEVFHRAAAWDAPLMMTAPGKYGSGPIFGTPENFDRYCLQKLIEKRADELQGDARLIVTGYGNFRSEHTAMHELLDGLKVPHVYVDGPQRPHTWHSGWVEEAARLLMK